MKINIILSSIFLSVFLMACHQRTVNEKQQVPKKETIAVSVNDHAKLLVENDTLAIYKIDSVAFHQIRRENEVKHDTLLYTTDIEEAKKMLVGRVQFGGFNTETNTIDSTINGGMIYSIKFSNGKEIGSSNSSNFWDMGFWKYYPTEEILLCEGGHSSDFSFDLKNGLIGPELVGNPSYIVPSASGKYRLNGWFPGQECSDYFIQKKTDQGYRRIVGVPMDLTKEGFDLCNIADIFWKGDTELYFRNTYYSDNNDPRLGFFKLVLKLK